MEYLELEHINDTPEITIKDIADIIRDDYIQYIVNSNYKYYEADEEDCFIIAEMIFDDIKGDVNDYLDEYLEKNDYIIDLA